MLISFIIPIFNTQKYLEDLTVSLNQNYYKNIEFIFIDDKSTDDSVQHLKFLLKDFKNKYQIHLNSTNKGLSYTRNKGLTLAKGKYVFFLDSDDWIAINSIEIMENLIVSYPGIDIFIFKDEKKDFYSKEKINNSIEKYPIESNINLLNYRHMSSCIKLYKKELFLNISFKEGKLYEDVYLLVDLFNKKNLKIINTNLPLYNYRKNSASITNSEFTEYKFIEYKCLFDYCKEKLEKNYYEFIYLRLKRHLLEQAKTSDLKLYTEKLNQYEKAEDIDTLNLLFLMWMDNENPSLKKEIIKKIHKDVQLYEFLDYKYKEIAKQKKWIESKDYWLNEKDKQIKELTDDRFINKYLKVKRKLIGKRGKL